MLNLEIKKRQDVWTDDLKKPGHWVVANIDTSIAWPVDVHEITFAGVKFWVLPVTTDAYPGIAARLDGISRENLEKLMLQLLSAISWVDGGGISLNSFSGGSLPGSMGRSQEGGYTIRSEFDYPYLPEVEGDKAKLALALMREGRGLNHTAYSFLSFYRVLEVAIGNGQKRKEWMPNALDRLQDSRASQAVADLRAEGIEDVAKHLFDSGRCAIAHASSDPIINPDDPADTRRLFQELPIMMNLAVLAIEEKLGVKTSSTIYREHLYELAGFKEIFGEQLVKQISEGDMIEAGQQLNLPNISFRLRGKPPFPPLENLEPVLVQQTGKSVQLRYAKEDRSIEVRFILNFEKERLEFDIHDGIYGSSDDDSPEFAETKSHMLEFTKWYFMNGRLEIINTESGKEISRKDAFIPVNVIVQPEGFDRDIEFWRGIAATRREIAG